MHTTRIAILLALPLAACYQSGELGNLGVHLGLTDTLYEFESGDRVLAGTRICPQLAHAKISDDEGYPIDAENRHCFSESLTGPAQFDDKHCLALDTPGEVVWEVIPTKLEGCHPDYVGDRVILEVAAPSNALRLGFDDWRLRAPMADMFSGCCLQNVVGLEPGQTLDDLREDPGAPRRVFVGQLDTPMLRLDDDLGRLYFGYSDVAFELVGDGVTPVQPDHSNGFDGFVFQGERPLMLALNAFARVRAKLPGGLVLESPQLISVPPSDAASLDLLVMLSPDEVPTYAHARVRDAQGRVLHGAPIEWSVVEGALGVQAGALVNQARSSEYALLEGTCVAPSESEFIERHAVLRARLGALEDVVELNWIEPPLGPGAGQSFKPDQVCMFGGGEEVCVPVSDEPVSDEG